MGSGLGGRNTVVRVSGSNNEAIGIDNLNGEVLHAAQNFYRKQASQQAAGIGHYSHKVVEEKFTDGSSATFDYKSNFGMEYLDIRWSASVPEIPKIPEVEIPVEEYGVPDVPTLLVFHNGNEVSMYSLAALPKLKFLRHKTCRYSSWGTEKLLTSQFKFGKQSTIMSPLHFAGGKVTASSTHNVTVIAYKQGSLEERFVISGGIGKSIRTSTNRSNPPLQNSDGETLYTTNDVYNMSNGGLDLKGHVTDLVPYAISSDGTYDFGAVVQGWNSTLTSAATLPTEATDKLDEAMAEAQKNNVYTGDIYSATFPEILGTFMSATMSSSGSVTAYANVDLVSGGNYSSPAGEDWGLTTYNGSKDAMSGTLNMVTYSGDGGVDVVKLEATSGSCVVSLSIHNYGITAPGYSEHTLHSVSSGSVSYGNAHESWSQTYNAEELMGNLTESKQASGNNGVIQLMGFPPGIPGSIGFYISAMTPMTVDGTASDPNITFYTPYRDFNQSGGGWLHCSNGRHYIQGFVLESKRAYLYCDGVDISDEFRCSLSSIQTMVMGISMSTIDSIS